MATPPRPPRALLTGPTAPAVRQRVVTDVARRGVRGLDRAFYERDRKLSLAMRAAHDTYATELGGAGPPSASASALIWSIVITQLRRDTLATIVIELGSRIVNKNKRAAYPIVDQLGNVERLLADLLRQFQLLKSDSDIDRRLEALEEARKGRTIDVT